MMRPEEIYGRGSLKRHRMPCTSFAHALCACGIDACRVTNPQGVCSGESPARTLPKKAILDFSYRHEKCLNASEARGASWAFPPDPQ